MGNKATTQAGSSTAGRGNSTGRSGAGATIAVGDRVRVKPSVREPRRGWGDISHSDVGTVKEIDFMNIKVDFRKQSGWNGLLEEMELVTDASGATVTVSSNPEYGYHILDGNDGACWQSNAKEGGTHWVMVELPREVSTIEEVELFLQEPQNASHILYLPENLELMVGPSKTQLQTVKTFKVTSYDWTTLIDTSVPGRFFKMVIKSCHLGGADVRIFGLQIKCKLRDGSTLHVPTHSKRAEAEASTTLDPELIQLLLLARAAGIALPSLSGVVSGASRPSDDPKVKVPDDLSAMEEGSIVRIKPGVTPQYGWGAANPDMIGELHEIRNPELVLIDFPDIPRTYWKCRLDELERTVDTSGAVVTVSTNGDKAKTLFDSNANWYWESDGRRGEHWIMLTLPTDIVSIEAAEICVPRTKNTSYLPEKIDILVGQSVATLQAKATSKINSYNWSTVLDRSAAGRYIRFDIKSCHQNGVDVRISAVRVCGKKASGAVVFFPNHTAHDGKFDAAKDVAATATVDSGVSADGGSGESGPRLLQGRYRLTSVIGSGGFGVTWLAQDLHLMESKCVVKELHNTSPDSTRMLQEEAKRLYELDHPCIPKLKAFFDMPGERKFYVVMDLIDGEDFNKYIANNGPVGALEGRTVARQMMGALAYIHERNIVHRDIKPHNVMRRSASKIAIVDFGASILLEATQQLASTIIGTPGYMAPELARGMGQPASDYYSTGALLLFILTSKHAHQLADHGTAEPFAKTLGVLLEAKRIDMSMHTLISALLLDNPVDRLIASKKAAAIL